MKLSLMRKFALAGGVCACVALSGCTAMTQIKHQSDQQYGRALSQTQPYLEAMHQPPQQSNGPIVSNLPYVSTTPISHSAAYPAVFSEHVTINPPADASVAALLHSISALSGVQISADLDLLTDQPATSAAPVSTKGKDATLNLPPSIIGDSSGGAGDGAPAYVGNPIHYSGDLKGLLDQVGLVLDAKWTYNRLRNEVHFFRYETKVFTLATTPGDATNTSTIGGQQQSIQGAQGQSLKVSGADAQTKFSGDLTVWKSVGEAIKSMLSPAGSMTISQATGTIVVHDRYDRIAEIGNYVDQVNNRLEMAVLVNVTVYRIHVSNEDNRGINWNIMYNTLGRMANRVGATIATSRVPISGGSSLVLSAPNQNAQGKPSWFGGSQFFLDALSTLGKTSVVTHSSVYTTNNQPAPVKVVEDQSYLAQTTPLYTTGVSGGNTGVVGAGATLTPGNIETGFTMQVLPSVQPDGHRMLLQMTISDSTLDEMDTYTSGGASIQLPHVTARETMQRAWLQSGQTLVLAGFENTQAGNTTKTPFGRNTWLFGGNRDITSAHDAIVIVITPIVTNANGSDDGDVSTL